MRRTTTRATVFAEKSSYLMILKKVLKIIFRSNAVVLKLKRNTKLHQSRFRSSAFLPKGMKSDVMCGQILKKTNVHV